MASMDYENENGTREYGMQHPTVPIFFLPLALLFENNTDGVFDAQTRLPVTSVIAAHPLAQLVATTALEATLVALHLPTAMATPSLGSYHILSIYTSL